MFFSSEVVFFNSVYSFAISADAAGEVEDRSFFFSDPRRNKQVKNS